MNEDNTIGDAEEKPKPVQEQIDWIMDNFDFQKVLHVMRMLNWKWIDGPLVKGTDGNYQGKYKYPYESELRTKARKLLQEIAREGAGAGEGGGFVAICDKGWLRLYFAVESWSND